MLIHEGRGGEKWQRRGERFLQSYALFDVKEIENEAPDGKRAKLLLLDTPEWASVVPLIQHEGRAHYLMVRQYRHGADAICIEFPGGVMEKNESPETAAARELFEESGYRARRLDLAGWVYPNPAFQNNRFNVVIARDLVQEAAPHFDEHEILDAFLEPCDEVDERMGGAGYRHGLMVVALALVKKFLANEKKG